MFIGFNSFVHLVLRRVSLVRFDLNQKIILIIQLINWFQPQNYFHQLHISWNGGTDQSETDVFNLPICLLLK